MQTQNPDHLQNQSTDLEQEGLVFSESDALFLKDLVDIRGMIVSDNQAGRTMFAIRRLKEQQERLKESKKDYLAFFEQKEEQLQSAIDMLTQRIESYMNTTGDEKLITPNGTSFFTTRKQYTYPDEEELIAYAKQVGLEVKVKESVSKTDIKKFVEDGGEPPKGFQVNENRSLSIRFK